MPDARVDTASSQKTLLLDSSFILSYLTDEFRSEGTEQFTISPRAEELIAALCNKFDVKLTTMVMEEITIKLPD